MFESTPLLADLWSVLLAAASYLSFMKPLCKPDPTVNFRAAQGV